MTKQLVSSFLLLGLTFAACNSSSTSAIQPAPTLLTSTETSDVTDACLQEAKTQVEMNECAERQLRVAVARLDSTQTRITETLPTSLKPDFDNVNELWRMYRDQHCQIANHRSKGGSIHILHVTLCKARLTRQRTETLEASFRDPRR